MILHKLVHGLNESQPFLKPLNETFLILRKKNNDYIYHQIN